MSALSDFLSDVPDALRAIRRQFARVMNWRLIRNVAELQLLTRASYVTLIVVPLLAGLWPTVRLVVNQHNKAVAEAATIFDKATVRFEQAQHQLTLPVSQPQQTASLQAQDLVGPLSRERATIEANKILDELKQSVAQYKSDYASKAIESPRMPRTFAAAFLAALAAVMAHTLYQMGAPEPVRKMTLDQFVAAKKDDYSRHPTPIALETAQATLDAKLPGHDHFFRQRRLRDKILETSDDEAVARSLSVSEEVELQSLLGRGFFHDSDRPRVDHILHLVRGGRTPQQLEEFNRQQNMAVVAEAAEYKYLQASNRAPLVIIATAVIYAFALYLILTILVNQTGSVMSSSGIDSFDGIAEWWKPRLPRT
jgi:hypothetical protein